MQTLAQFADLWDALYPRERIRLAHSLFESVTDYDETGRIEIRFMPESRCNSSSRLESVRKTN